MSQRLQQASYDGWEKKKNLGNGGFGTVDLWHHEESGESIALKKCRLVNEMKEKHRERWVMEIEIMLRLDHLNIIHAIPVPQPLLVLAEYGLPMLAMEYCNHGDLRSVLNLPENCTGLPETQVRNISQDIGAGIEYLHKKRIIHRDLKPENVVLQKIDEKRIVYKLIDLGYAKDMDQGSICTSFVGTLQYLAPEFFQTRQYTATVDYWSFGTLIFECIAGFRPFLHGHSPAQWHYEVSKKPPTAIHAYLNDHGTISFSSNLPQPNQLCTISRQWFEEWLRLMLRWDPRERGGVLTAQKRTTCFALLDNIISTKILYIVCVRTNKLLMLPIEKPSQPLSVIQSYIEKESGIPVAQQEFLYATGLPAMPSHSIENCWTDDVGKADSCNLFLFRLDGAPMESLATWRRAQTQLPPLVTAMLGDPTILMMYQEQRKVWSHVMYFAQQSLEEYNRLLVAEQAARLNLERMSQRVGKKKDDMIASVMELAAKIRSFEASVKLDLENYEKQAKTGITSNKMKKKWEKQQEDIKAYGKMQEEVEQLREQCNACLGRVQKMTLGVEDRQDSELQAIQQKVLDKYKQHRNTPHEERKKGQDNRAMVQLVASCRDVQERLSTNLHTQFSTISRCKSELRQLEPRIDQLLAHSKSADEDLMSKQKQRQNDLWHLVKVALMIESQSPTGDDNPPMLDLQSMTGSYQPPSTYGPNYQQQQLGGAPSSHSHSEGGAQSASIIHEAMDASLCIISDNNPLLNSLTLPRRRMDTADADKWSFLDLPTQNPRNPPTPPPPAPHTMPTKAAEEQTHHAMPPSPSQAIPPGQQPHTYVNVQGRNIPPQYVNVTIPTRQVEAAASTNNPSPSMNLPPRSRAVGVGRGLRVGAMAVSSAAASASYPYQYQQQQEQQVLQQQYLSTVTTATGSTKQRPSSSSSSTNQAAYHHPPSLTPPPPQTQQASSSSSQRYSPFDASDRLYAQQASSSSATSSPKGQQQQQQQGYTPSPRGSPYPPRADYPHPGATTPAASPFTPSQSASRPATSAAAAAHSYGDTVLPARFGQLNLQQQQGTGANTAGWQQTGIWGAGAQQQTGPDEPGTTVLGPPEGGYVNVQTWGTETEEENGS